MEFLEVANAAIQIAQLVKEICDKVKSNKEKCGLLAKLSDEVGSILQKHFGDSQKASRWRQDKAVFARVETIRFCLKNAEELIRNYLGKQGLEKGLLIINAINIDAKFQRVIDDLKDAERQLVQAVTVDAAANQGDSSEIAANQRYMQEFLQAAERDRQRDIAVIQEELKANGRNDEALQRKLEAVIQLLMKQSMVSFDSPSSAPSSSMHVSVAAGKTDADYAYFITPDCIEYERSSKKAKGDNRVKLGQGGSGTVYKAKLRRSLPVAVKVLDDSATNQAALDELRQEIRIMSCLSHPNIICFLGGYYPTTHTMHDEEEEEEEAYLVMEFAENKSLAYHLGMLRGENVQKLSRSTKIMILSGLTDGLYYLHMQKIVHRDIKPDNVLLNRDFEAKLSDFGLAKVKASSVSSSTKGGSAGTHGYQSAEMINMTKPSFPADILAFGVIMVECMIDERVFNNCSPLQITNMVCSNKLPLEKMKRFELHWPKDYVELIKSCLKFDANKRPTAMDISLVMHGIMEISASTAGYISSLDEFSMGGKPDFVDPTSAGSNITTVPSSRTNAVIPLGTEAPKLKAFSEREIEALFKRGERFYHGNIVSKADYKRAVEYFRQAADYKHSAAQFRLGVCYKNGQGVVQNYKQAVDWYRLAANQGNAEAQYDLGLCYDNGQGVVQDRKQAVEWYQKAANQGHVQAQITLGVRSNSGHGVAKDHADSKKWYQRAADQNKGSAKQALSKLISSSVTKSSSSSRTAAQTTSSAQKPGSLSGREIEVLLQRGEDLYYGRNGIKIDYVRAVQNYRQGADQNHAEAQFRLGVCYKNGQGVAQDDKQAVYWYQLAAMQGHGESQFSLGSCYENGEGVVQDYEQAAEWYRLAAKQGHAQAQLNLGLCYDKGHGVAQDYKQATEWYRLAANQGNAIAQHNLGLCCEKGQGVAQDYKQASEWYRLAAEQGLAEAQYNLGVCYANGLGVAQDYSQAVKWYQLAANQGNAKAQCGLGNCYKIGQGATPDHKQAVEWYQKAANQGNALAQYMLGVCYNNGEGVTQDSKQAVEWYRSAANEGNANAQYDLGLCYANGQGVVQDYRQAVEWYRLAANQGNAIAQYNLGLCYEKGQGVALDSEQAVGWYKKAADRGHAQAQFNLGVCYAKGQGVAQDYKQASEWYRLAAVQGHAEAQYDLGVCYANGRGVAQDYNQAVEWYRLAAKQGHAQSQFNLGNHSKHGQGVAKDFVDAKKWYMLAANQGNGLAKTALANLYK